MGRRADRWFARFGRILVLALLASVGCGDGDGTRAAANVGALEITNAYASGVMDSGAVYFTVKNTGDADDALTAVSTDVAGRSELHITVTEGASVKMQLVEEVDILAKGETKLEPGGYHVMLTDLEEPLNVARTIAVELTFEKAGSVSMHVPVTSYGESDDRMDE